MNLPVVGNLNSTHGQIVLAVVILLIFSYVEDGRLVEGPLEHLGGTGLVLFVLGVVYLNAVANRSGGVTRA